MDQGLRQAKAQETTVVIERADLITGVGPRRKAYGEGASVGTFSRTVQKRRKKIRTMPHLFQSSKKF